MRGGALAFLNLNINVMFQTNYKMLYLMCVLLFNIAYSLFSILFRSLRNQDLPGGCCYIILIMYSYKAQKLALTARNYKFIRQSDLPSPNNYQRVIQTIKQHSSSKLPYADLSIQILRKWYNLAVPTLVANSEKLFTNLEMDQIYTLWTSLKFHRQQIVDITEKKISPQYLTNIKLPQILKTYQYFVLMKHNSNFNLLNRIRAQCLAKIKAIQSTKLIHKNLISYLVFIQTTLLDINLTIKQKKQIIQKISFLSLNQINLFKSSVTNHFYAVLSKNIFQLLKIQNITVNDKLMEIFENAHSNIEQIIKNDNRFDISEVDSQKQKFNSIFEKIFQNKLREYGFQFDSNVFLKGNEYDVIVKARKYSKNYPFSNINIFEDDLSQLPIIPIELIKKVANSSTIQLIENYKKFDHEIVLDLNGPLHYIDSDVLPENSVTRLQQFKFEKLTLYGINKYNIINFNEWEKANQYPKLSEKFVNDKIMNAKTIKVRTQ